MSVIAWDGKTLAADKRATFGGNLILTTTKIRRIGNMLVGYAGGADFGEQMVQWVADGADPADFPTGQRDKDDWAGVLVLRPGQPVARYERTPYPILFEDRCVAVGSGRDFAMAAMYLGCDAKRAVEVACALDVNCGNGVDVLTMA
jgi:ATP-dependent protease HslVU (ClpYQ) peptidase subunit